ncbi:hypothetical protein FRC14_005189 [Serendipita sp. 396]|nr:hypothetical protein FRC14_005189 [Serendipita sp. 396]KAG8826009.1 hypothetical protein FRC19_010013 [Serendipita sp. 401]KAG8872548.1 hypothetical protein FRC20_009399 [Serendipita sp. 405]
MMELETYDSPASPSFNYYQPTSKTYYSPPPLPYPDDLTTLQIHEQSSTSPRRWYSTIPIPLPLLYGIHFVGMLAFGLATLLLGLLGGGYRKNKTAFWDICPEFMTFTITFCLLVLVHQFTLPAFWRRRAQELIRTGMFSHGGGGDNKYGFTFSGGRSGGRGGGKVVLELGCNEGSTSAIFAREILSHQGDVANLSIPSASLPTFVGYDRWSSWSRIPNGPAHYLSTLMKAGVPRDNIKAYTVDMSSLDARVTLPFADDTFDLIICNLGISEIVGIAATKPKYRNKLFTEMTRVLRSGEGMMIVVETDATIFKSKEDCAGKQGDSDTANPAKKKKSWFEGTMGPYRRILVDGLKWPESNVKLHKAVTLSYLVALKPVGANTSLPV